MSFQSVGHSATVSAFAVFETAIGACGIVWNERGVRGLHLPERDASAVRDRLRRRFPDSHEANPPSAVRDVIDQVTALLRGERVDLRTVSLDMSGVSEFERDVYDAAREIPPGATLTYGEIARRIGRPAAARDVGVALGRNPFPIVVPCHRVVAANGKTGGFSAVGGVKTKLKLLAIEGGAGPLFD
jgi:methylated-DNA-[protein]-cysteine S-methyltransferase